jgi:16S rRNA processing protein RimM
MRRQKADLERTNKQTGSSQIGEPEFLAVGKIRKPHGVKGEMEMEILTDFPDRIRPKKILYFGETHCPKQIISTRWKNTLMLIFLEGVSTLEAAAMARNEIAYVKTDELPSLPKGEYYHHEILGLNVIDAKQQFLGTVKEILITGANDVYVVQNENLDEILIPALKSVLENVDLVRGEIIVNLPEGLI